MQDLQHFLAPVHFLQTMAAGTYQPEQLGYSVSYATEKGFDWEEADIIIIGCGEMRGESHDALYSHSPDAVRKQLYQMYNWHPQLKIADGGNILEGATVGDTRAALRTVLAEISKAGKVAIVLGGSHDLTFQQYEAFKKTQTVINATVADMRIDLDDTESVTSGSFLMDMLTEQPNYIRHYSHIGFQSYYVHPHMLQTLDKLRFDFYRVGRVKEHIEDMEPVLRASDLFSFDISAIAYNYAPANSAGSPNGLTGEEACTLTRYAGMSAQLSTFGIYGYDTLKDLKQMTAKQIAQMIWYFIDGYAMRKTEASLTDADSFVKFHVNFTETHTLFMKSKRTSRWWMELPDKSFVPCSYNDYITASHGEIPERWLREQERLV
ncbi:MAG TPA: formimidoylglutamase [Flavipsychrobacter sp.]|nr:formimidoylglutamase [Flavipsychrobacter sp.]